MQSLTDRVVELSMNTPCALYSTCLSSYTRLTFRVSSFAR
jgi:hypothetical protein